MVWLFLSLIASARSAPRLIHALRLLTTPLRIKPGYLRSHTWTAADRTVHYQEEWATEFDMRKRIRSDAFTRLLAVVEQSEGLPHVEFSFVTITRGLDYVAEVRENLGRPPGRRKGKHQRKKPPPMAAVP